MFVIEPNTKFCCDCGTAKPLSEFYKTSYRGQSRLVRRCKPCHKIKFGEMQKVWSAKCRQKRDYNAPRRFKKFGISAEQYSAMEIAQNGKCPICRKTETSQNRKSGRLKSLSVDHHHTTGAVRGLLYAKCNIGIGYFNGDPDLMIKAAAYLERHGIFAKEDKARGGENALSDSCPPSSSITLNIGE